MIRKTPLVYPRPDAALSGRPVCHGGGWFAAVDEHPVSEPAHAKRDGHQTHRTQDDASGNILGMNQVERSGEEQTRGETGLYAQFLLMEEAGQAGGVV